MWGNQSQSSGEFKELNLNSYTHHYHAVPLSLTITNTLNPPLQSSVRTVLLPKPMRFSLDFNIWHSYWIHRTVLWTLKSKPVEASQKTTGGRGGISLASFTEIESSDGDFGAVHFSVAYSYSPLCCQLTALFICRGWGVWEVAAKDERALKVLGQSVAGHNRFFTDFEGVLRTELLDFIWQK